jgi:hypothetical protein
MRRHPRRRRIRAQRAYRLLVLLYPAGHRRAFGEQMVQTFGDHYDDAVEDRHGSRMRFWLAVIADLAVSLAVEHVAEVKARARGVVSAAHRRRVRTLRTHEPARRRSRVRRRLRYRRPGHPRNHVMLRTHRIRLVYRGRPALLAVVVTVAGIAVGAGSLAGHSGISSLGAGLVVAAWLAYRVRLTPPVFTGPHGDGPAPSGGAGVREPRRPLPICPAGSALRPRFEDDPGDTVAVLP